MESNTLEQQIYSWIAARKKTNRQLRRAHKARRLHVSEAVEAKNADKQGCIEKGAR